MPDALSRDLIEDPLCPHCFAPIELHGTVNQQSEVGGTVLTIGALRGGPTVEQFLEVPLEALGDPVESKLMGEAGTA